MKEIEEGAELHLDFQKLGKEIIPVVIQNYANKEVLLLGYTNQIALEQTIKTKKITLWSTSRNELWLKGATSGNYLELVEIRVNCEQNSLLYLVKVIGQGVCHTKTQNQKYRSNCFYRKLNLDNQKLEII